MSGTISPNVAAAAVALHKGHPQATPRDVLDTVMRGRSGGLDEFGDTIKPGSPFGLIIAAAFDAGMLAQDWQIVNNANADPALMAGLLAAWRMCYSAQVIEEYKAYIRHCNAGMSLEDYFKIFWRRANDAYSISIPRGAHQAHSGSSCHQPVRHWQRSGR